MILLWGYFIPISFLSQVSFSQFSVYQSSSMIFLIWCTLNTKFISVMFPRDWQAALKLDVGSGCLQGPISQEQRPAPQPCGNRCEESQGRHIFFEAIESWGSQFSLTQKDGRMEISQPESLRYFRTQDLSLLYLLILTKLMSIICQII